MRLEKDKEAKEKGVASSKEMMLTLVEKGVAHLRSYTVAHLKDLIRYEFKSDVYKQQGIKKAGLVDAATVLYQQRANGNEEVNEHGEVNNTENNAASDASLSDAHDVACV